MENVLIAENIVLLIDMTDTRSKITRWMEPPMYKTHSKLDKIQMTSNLYIL